MEVKEMETPRVTIRPAFRREAAYFWRQIYHSRAWKQFDAPYIPLEPVSFWSFRFGLFRRFIVGDSAKVICVDERPVGYVTFYWEDKRTRWLEVGITIFDPADWGKGIGRRALILWVDELFRCQTLNRIGLTTWSGNPGMMRCAKALGMKEEGRLRSVRFFQGEYYDALRFGVLREEWYGLHHASTQLGINNVSIDAQPAPLAAASTMHKHHTLV